MLLTEQDLDLATWPFRVRPADEAIRRLNESPLCPKHGGRTTWKARNLYGMCPSCWKVWSASTRIAQPEDVTPEAVVAIRDQAHRGRYNAREKIWVSPALETLAREANRVHPIEGKEYGVALIAYILTHPEFLPQERAVVPLRMDRRDRGIGVRCKYADENGVITHDCRVGPPICICHCHGGQA